MTWCLRNCANSTSTTQNNIIRITGEAVPPHHKARITAQESPFGDTESTVWHDRRKVLALTERALRR